MAVMQQGIQPSIVDRIARAQAANRRDFLLKFSLTWAVIIAGIALAIWSTGNADPAFTITWAPFILGGAGITVFICVTSITLATALAIVGALGRLSVNPFINGAASLYVSLVRGTPLIVQIYFIFFALPLMGIVLDPDSGRHPRPGLQLRRLHDRDLPGRHPGGAQGPARGRPGAGHAGATDHAPDRPAAGHAHRRAGHRQRLRGHDQGQLARLRGRVSRSCSGGRTRSGAATSSSSRRCSSRPSSTGR